MNILKQYILTAAILGIFSSTHAAALGCSPAGFHNEQGQRDFEAVQEFVNSKRTIPLEEKDCNLSLSGDVRFTWAHIVERRNEVKFRGPNGKVKQPETGDDKGIPTLYGTGVPIGKDAFEVEFNLYADYTCDRAWAVAWVQYANDAGIFQNNLRTDQDPQGLFGSGCGDGLCLRKAYMGYNVCADGCSRFDIEVGRRPMYNVFDSRVQFQSNFDGILLRYARSMECYGDFHWNVGAFVVNERADDFAWVQEFGLKDIYGSGLNLKYALTDWHSLHKGSSNGAKYLISQFSASYDFLAEYVCMPGKFYGAILVNHCAEDFSVDYLDIQDANGVVQIPSGTKTLNKKDNLAWYIGMIVGEVCQEGDWAFDASYQYVEVLAVPDGDFSGIGRNGNNLLGQTATSPSPFVGFTNIQGWRFEGLYALTDNITVDATLEFGKQISKLGAGQLGEVEYSKFQLSSIYAF